MQIDHNTQEDAFGAQNTAALLSLSLCLSAPSIYVSNPMQWKNDKQGEPETTDRDELILVVYNSRHSNGV